MNDFGFLPDDTLDIGQAWADSESAATAVLPETSPSKPFGGWTGEVPYAPDASYTSGHVRADGLQFDENGFVAGTTFMPQESLSFVDAVGSGAEYLKEKLKARGWSGACCGGCASASNGCNSQDLGTPDSRATHVATNSLGPGGGSLSRLRGGGEDGTCCCCVTKVCVVLDDLGYRNTGVRLSEPRFTLNVDVDYVMIGFAPMMILGQCFFEWHELLFSDTKVYQKPPFKIGTWIRALESPFGKGYYDPPIRDNEDWKNRQEGECGKIKGWRWQDKGALFPMSGTFFIFLRACSGRTCNCGIDCCCGYVRVSWRRTRWLVAISFTLLGPVCGDPGTVCKRMSESDTLRVFNGIPDPTQPEGQPPFPDVGSPRPTPFPWIGRLQPVPPIKSGYPDLPFGFGARDVVPQMSLGREYCNK